MKFIHISNVHLGKMPDENYKWAEARKDDIYKNFEKVADVCNNDEIDVLLIAGDLFDNIEEVSVLDDVNALFSKLTNTKVTIITGYDVQLASTYSDYNWSDNVTVLSEDGTDRIYFEDINTEVFCRREDNGYKNIVEGRCNILLGYMSDDDCERTNFMKLFAKGFRYVALGGKSMYCEVTNNVVYSGSLETLCYEDKGTHGYIKGEIDDNGVSYELIPHSIRSYFNEVINVDMEVTDNILIGYIETIINQRGRDNIFVLNIEGFRSPCVNFSLDDLFLEYNIMSIEDNSLPHYDFDIIYETNKDNLIGKYIKKVRSMEADENIIQKALYLGVEALIKK